MKLFRFLSLALVFAINVHSQDSPNDDSDDALPSCAAACQASLGSLAGACGNGGALGAFNACVGSSRCSDDDKEGSQDWISSTCEVISRSVTMTSSTASSSSASVTTTTTTSASTTSSTASTSGTTSISITSSRSSTISSSTTSSSVSSTATSTTPTPTAPPPDQGLSAGAKAGIGVGAALAALAIIAGIVFFCVRHMRQSRRESKGQWPANLAAWEEAKGIRGSNLDGNEHSYDAAAAAIGPGAAGNTRGSRFDPQDPYSPPRPLPDAPELGGVMRSELHGQPLGPPGNGMPPPRQQEQPRGFKMVELPVEGAAIVGPLQAPGQEQQRQIARKPPAAAANLLATDTSADAVAGPSGRAGTRVVSAISSSSVATSGPGDLPSPTSPVSTWR